MADAAQTVMTCRTQHCSQNINKYIKESSFSVMTDPNLAGDNLEYI